MPEKTINLFENTKIKDLPQGPFEEALCLWIIWTKRGAALCPITRRSFITCWGDRTIKELKEAKRKFYERKRKEFKNDLLQKRR